MNRASSDNRNQPIVAGPSTATSRIVRWEDLGERIRAKRRADGLTLEQAARQSGVSAATLSRWERQWVRQQMIGENLDPDEGDPTPDTRTLAAITRWLGVSVASVMEVELSPQMECVLHRQGEDTPDMVEAHLRADRNLDSETAAALARMFRVAYEQFTRLRSVPAQPVGNEGNAQEISPKGTTSPAPHAGKAQRHDVRERTLQHEQDAAD
jgi:hypothetical protein